jgi:ATP-dependent DNA ligase
MGFEFKGVQLANHWSEWPEGVEHVIVEPKVDGYRLSAIVNEDGAVAFHCRDPEPPKWIEHLGHIGLEISDLGLEPGTMLDGEVMAADWNETSKLLRRFRETMDEDDCERIRREVKMFAFDMIDLKRLETRPPVKRQRKPRLVEATPQHERTMAVRALIGNHPRSALQRLPGKLCTTIEEVDAAYAEFCLTYEGAIVKLPDEPYYFNRSDAWLKIKPTATVDITITGSVEGQGKHVGRLGALLGITDAGDAVRVGTGQSDEERVRLWAMRDQLPGMRCEISHQKGTVAKARHPVYMRLRDLG